MEHFSDELANAFRQVGDAALGREDVFFFVKNDLARRAVVGREDILEMTVELSKRDVHTGVYWACLANNDERGRPIGAKEVAQSAQVLFEELWGNRARLLNRRRVAKARAKSETRAKGGGKGPGLGTDGAASPQQGTAPVGAADAAPQPGAPPVADQTLRGGAGPLAPQRPGAAHEVKERQGTVGSNGLVAEWDFARRVATLRSDGESLDSLRVFPASPGHGDGSAVTGEFNVGGLRAQARVTGIWWGLVKEVVAAKAPTVFRRPTERPLSVHLSWSLLNFSHDA